MKFLNVLFTLAVVVIGLVLLAPLIGLLVAVAVPLVGLAIWLFPILIIASSNKTTGGEKAAWILAIVFLSWFAWVFYFLFAPIVRRRDYDRYADYGYSDYRPYRYRPYR